jgi:hypothetical protein
MPPRISIHPTEADITEVEEDALGSHIHGRKRLRVALESPVEEGTMTGVDNERSLKTLHLNKMMVEKQHNVIRLMQVSIDSLRALSNAQTNTIANLQKCIGEMDTNMELICKKDATVRTSLNNLRYVLDYREDPSRGMMRCPITLTWLVPNETVVVIKGTCECNCMVKIAVEVYLDDKVRRGEEIHCLVCGTLATGIMKTTVHQAEKNFAWKRVEKLTSCHSFGVVAKRRLRKLETRLEEQKTLDTLPFRLELELIRASMHVSEKPHSVGSK